MICPVCFSYMLDHIRGYKKCRSCGFTKDIRMITKAELLMGRDKTHADEYTQEISDNLDILLEKINKVREAYGKPMTVNSGWRPAGINAATPGAAKSSKHCLGLAVDIADPSGEVFEWCLNNLQLLESLDLFLEDKRWTESWTHFGVGAPKSGKRIFVPSSAPASAPDAWDGTYDHKFDVKV